METRVGEVDSKLANVLAELDTACASHPNVAIMWRSYLLQKVRRLVSEIDKCEHLMANILPEIDDIPLTTLLLLGHMPMLDNATAES